jgi:hypothetical protein
MFKKGDIIEYDDYGYLNKVKLFSDVIYDHYTSSYGHTGIALHCKGALHLEGRYAGTYTKLFFIDQDCRLSLPFRIGKPIKKHIL